MTPEKITDLEDIPDESEPGDQTDSLPEVRSLDVWARSAPIRLAGYEDDLTETHILRGID